VCLESRRHAHTHVVCLVQNGSSTHILSGWASMRGNGPCTHVCRVCVWNAITHAHTHSVCSAHRGTHTPVVWGLKREATTRMTCVCVGSWITHPSCACSEHRDAQTPLVCVQSEEALRTGTPSACVRTRDTSPSCVWFGTQTQTNLLCAFGQRG